MSLKAGSEIIIWGDLGHWFWRLPSQRENAGQLLWRTGFFSSLASNWFCGFSKPFLSSMSASSCVKWVQKLPHSAALVDIKWQCIAEHQGPRQNTWNQEVSLSLLSMNGWHLQVL